MSKKKHEVKTKLKIIKEYEAGCISVYQLAKKYGIDTKSIHSWYRNYQSFGKEAFTGNHANLNYTANFKKEVVLYYLQGGRSYQEVALKFGIYAPTTVIQWVKQYNNHEELTTSRPEGVVNMVKNNGRKTTLEERISIVEYCIQHENDYATTAMKCEVSYQQVYSWVQRYNKSGPNGLLDNRGKAKAPEELSELDQLRIENRMLKAGEKQQRMEIDFLKKLEEIERRRF
jgi:transposase-like protein